MFNRIPLLLGIIAVPLSVFAEQDKNIRLQDPTRPLSYQAKVSAPSYFRLNSILFSGDRKAALINGVLVTEQGYVNGAQVMSITQGKVTLNVAGKLKHLRLGSKSMIKTKVKENSSTQVAP